MANFDRSLDYDISKHMGGPDTTVALYIIQDGKTRLYDTFGAGRQALKEAEIIGETLSQRGITWEIREEAA